MTVQQKLDAALALLAEGDYNRAYVLASEVNWARYYAQNQSNRATCQQAYDAFTIAQWAIQMAYKAG